jgi:lysyl-tRNA synthetase class 2
VSSIEEIRNERIKKLELLSSKGIDPYPADSKRTHFANKFLESFEDLLSSGDNVFVAGRVMSLRSHGGSTFMDMFDGTARIQGYLKADEAGEEVYQLFVDTVDVGDFIELGGTAFKTKKDVPTVLAKEWRMLAKSLRPLPGEYYGFKDEEEKLRKRYLDILMNPEVRELVEKKSEFWRATRKFLQKNGFTEVETPTLELTTGGAEATPFKTHHEDYDLDVYLRISVGELWQKRLMAAGLPRTFEIGRIYRNEGSSPEHLQEFTSMEFYAAYMDYREGMNFTREMIVSVVKEVFGKTSFSTRGYNFDLGNEWERLDYVSTVEKMTGVNILNASEKQMEEKLSELGVEYEGKNRERLIDSLWKYCRKQIEGPAFLINHPKIVSPLSKSLPENPELTERVQLILAGSEMTNGFSELNDPIDQRERFEVQRELLEAGDTEAMMPDWEFVEMLEHGMPPTFGFAYGDRLFSFLIDKPIRETQIFPLMKPKDIIG